MYVPKAFDVQDRETLYAVIRDNSFGLLVGTVDGAPFATHLPFLLEGDTLGAHMARANPHWRAFAAGVEVLTVFQGPHAYVSPSWYAPGPLVPTWNYVAVHAYGVPQLVEDTDRLHGMLERLVATNEAWLEKPWSLDSLDRDLVRGMLRGIVGFEIPIARIEGKFKLSQNRRPEDRVGVIRALEASADPSIRAVAALMAARESDG